jgi:hypothetical protein
MERYLIVANQTLGGEHLTAKIRACLDKGPCRFHVVVPATRLDNPAGMTWSAGQAERHAQHQLERALERFRGLGAEVDGEVGAPDPLKAIEEALAGESFDKLIISTLKPGVSRWLRLDLPHRAERRFGLPIEHVESWEDVPAHGWHPW